MSSTLRTRTWWAGRSRLSFALHEDRLLSREHFKIEIKPPVCSLKDLGSTNGTKVNGLGVESAHLRDGDVITAGDSAFAVQVERTRLGGLEPILCLGCEQAAPVDCMRVLLEEGRPPGWLCDACQALRRQFPATHPDFLIERGSAAAAWARSTSPSNCRSAARSPSR